MPNLIHLTERLWSETQPTALTKHVTLIETPIHRTNTALEVVTKTNTVVVVTTTTIVATVSETGTVTMASSF